MKTGIASEVVSLHAKMLTCKRTLLQLQDYRDLEFGFWILVEEIERIKQWLSLIHI